MKRLFFPFTPLFDRLNLRQRWWHRLAVVVFFLAFIGVVSIAGILTGDLPQSLSPDERRHLLTTSFPLLDVHEWSLDRLDYEFIEPAKPKEAAASEGIDCYDAQGQLLVDEFAAFGGVTTGCAPGQTPKAKSERINVPQPRLHYVQQAESCQKEATTQFAKGDAGVYRKKMDECLDPKRYEGPAELQQFVDATPIKSVLKHDMETNQKAIRVEIPKVGVVAFPFGMKESDVTDRCKQISDRVTAAERRAKAITILYGLAALTVLFYLPQIAYRLFLYGVFGEGK